MIPRVPEKACMGFKFYSRVHALTAMTHIWQWVSQSSNCNTWVSSFGDKRMFSFLVASRCDLLQYKTAKLVKGEMIFGITVWHEFKFLAEWIALTSLRDYAAVVLFSYLVLLTVVRVKCILKKMFLKCTNYKNKSIMKENISLHRSGKDIDPLPPYPSSSKLYIYAL